MKGKVIDTNFRHNTITLKCDESVNHQIGEYVVIPVEKYKAPEMLEMLGNYLADLRNVVPPSDAQRSRIHDVEELIKSATEL